MVYDYHTLLEMIIITDNVICHKSIISQKRLRRVPHICMIAAVERCSKHVEP